MPSTRPDRLLSTRRAANASLAGTSQRDHASRGAELTEGIVRIRESMTRRLRA
jgi:hypothetical protein